MVDVQGLGAVVTGGGRGIGSAIAIALAQAGAHVIVASRTRSEIEQVTGQADRITAIPCDITDETSVTRLLDAARAHCTRIDILVNNAGIGTSAPLEDISMDDWNHTFAVNVTGTFLCSRAFAPPMISRGFGRIVNIASTAGLFGAKYIAAYAASKHAVVGFTRSIALELGPRGVLVNALCPAYVDTPMTHQTIDNVATKTGLDREAALQAILRTSGQQQLIPARLVAEQAVALCGRDSRVNGQALLMRDIP